MNGFSSGFAAGMILTAAVIGCIDGRWREPAIYKRGQTDALYGHWEYTRAHDAAGNDYVVEVPEKK